MVPAAQRLAHTRAVGWFGKKVLRGADALGDAVSGLLDRARGAAPQAQAAAAPSAGGGALTLSALAGGALGAALGGVEREVAAFRASAQRAYESALDAATSDAKYRRVVEETAGLEGDGVGAAAAASRGPGAGEVRAARAIGSASAALASFASTSSAARDLTANMGGSPAAKARSGGAAADQW
jgi:hypothetical protein